MVRTTVKSEAIIDIHQKNSDPDWINGGDGINVQSDFQRGDEETGVWTIEFKQNYIDSLQRGYPAGILTFVKDNKCATAYKNPWKVLDGGNRIRALRDYIDNKFVDLNGNKYIQLSEKQSAKFDNILIPCQLITIERSDPDITISDMFIRLNTKSNPLRHGELFKAHGHRGDIWQIEMAKKLIGDCWTSNFLDNIMINVKDNENINITKIRNRWKETLGNISETSRCDNLAMMIGFILSASTGNFTLFDKRYNRLQGYLSRSDKQLTNSERIDIYTKIYTKLWEFHDIISNIEDLSIFGKITKGMPPQTKIAPVWKTICEESMTPEHKTKMIRFYNTVNKNSTMRRQYYDLFKGSNSETSNGKIQKIIDFILDYQV